MQEHSHFFSIVVNLIPITFLCRNTTDIVDYARNILNILKVVSNGVKQQLHETRFKNLLKLTKPAEQDRKSVV